MIKEFTHWPYYADDERDAVQQLMLSVHLAGWPCDMTPIMELAAKHNLIVIEDCAQYFNYATNSMTEIQAAIGRIQLRKLDGWVETRRATAASFNQAFADLLALRLTIPPAEIYHSYYKYYMFVRPELLKPDWSRDRIMAEVTAVGVPCYSGSCSEIYLEKAFDSLRKSSENGEIASLPLAPREGHGGPSVGEHQDGSEPTNDGGGRVEMPGLENRLPVARELGETSLMLLVHPTLTEENISDTISVVKEVVARASR